MSVILLSIKPEYCKKIFDGSKKYEFRKRLANNNVKKIIVYATSPEMKVLGEVEVEGTLSMKKTPLWELTKKQAGISRKKYRLYFEQSTEAHAYILGRTMLYDKPLTLDSIGIKQAPQSFVYLPSDYIISLTDKYH